MKADDWSSYRHECGALGRDRLELSMEAFSRREAERLAVERLAAEAAARDRRRQQLHARRQLRHRRRQQLAWLYGRRRCIRGLIVGAALAMLAVTLLPRELMNLAVIGSVLSGVGLCIVGTERDAKGRATADNAARARGWNPCAGGYQPPKEAGRGGNK